MTFLTYFIHALGIIGGSLLVAGSFFREKPNTPPTKSLKNRLLFTGSIILLVFSALGFHFQNAPVLFIFIQCCVLLSSIFMFAQTKATISNIILGIAGLGMLGLSYYFEMFQNVPNIIGMLGFVTLAFAYSWATPTDQKIIERNALFAIASIFIAIFSFYGKSWEFFVLNIFFAIFSLWHIKNILQKS